MPIQELPAGEVFKTFVNDFGMTKDGRATKNPWTNDPLPDEIMKAPVEFYIYNVGPLRQVINAGSMGTHYLFPPAPGAAYGVPPLPIRKYMVDWADQGDYKHKPIIMDGSFVVKEWVIPNGERDNDLRKWGVFYSKNNPPTEEELEGARIELRKTLHAVVQRGDDLWESGKRKEITDIYRIAAEYMKESRPWCTKSRKMASCPGCGEAVNDGIKKHVACGWRFDHGCFEGEQVKATDSASAITPEKRASEVKAK